jgi:hypothetical protein
MAAGCVSRHAQPGMRRAGDRRPGRRDHDRVGTGLVAARGAGECVAPLCAPRDAATAARQQRRDRLVRGGLPGLEGRPYVAARSALRPLHAPRGSHLARGLPPQRRFGRPPPSRRGGHHEALPLHERRGGPRSRLAPSSLHGFRTGIRLQPPRGLARGPRGRGGDGILHHLASRRGRLPRELGPATWGPAPVDGRVRAPGPPGLPRLRGPDGAPRLAPASSTPPSRPPTPGATSAPRRSAGAIVSAWRGEFPG